MNRTKHPRITPPRRSHIGGQPAIVDGLFADPCSSESNGTTRCVLCGQAVPNTYLTRSNHARVHVEADEVCAHRDALGRTLYFPK